MALTNAEIKSLTAGNEATQQRPVQATDYQPLIVDLSTEITLGRAILDAIQADSSHPMYNLTEKQILSSITAIAFVNPATTVTVYAYQSASHYREVPADTLTYIPAVRLWRNYVVGPAATTLDMLVSI